MDRPGFMETLSPCGPSASAGADGRWRSTPRPPAMSSTPSPHTLRRPAWPREKLWKEVRLVYPVTDKDIVILRPGTTTEGACNR